MKRSMDQADRAMDIIKRISIFAKAGIEGEMKFEAISVAEVLEDILPLVRYELAANSIVLTREIPKDLPEVWADRRYLEEIFFNLIVNACQALKETGKAGEIRVNARVDPNTHPVCDIGLPKHTPGVERVFVTVEDIGPGISKEQLNRIFEPFYTTKALGTGLGLYVVKQLVEKNGGKVDVRSRMGEGTSFTITLSA